MKCRVVVLPGGAIQIFGDEGSFQDAAFITQNLLTHLQASNIPVEIVGTIEQHRDDVSHVHVHQESHHEYES